MTSYNLFLANEAYNWENATPVGCGKIGAMLFGGVKKEIIQFNEEKIWSGGPSEICSDGFYEKFQEVRNLLRTEGVADDLAQETLYPYFGRLKSYETAGSLIIAMLYDNDDPTVDYRRDLDLINGVASVTYKKGNVNYERTLFASYPAQMIAMQLSSDVPHSISFTATYTRSGPDEDANFAVVNGDINAVDGRTAFECSKTGDNAAVKVVNNYVKFLGESMLNFFNVFRPEAFILGGGVSAQGEYLNEKLRNYCEKYDYGYKNAPKTAILTAKLGNDAGIIGAAALVK